MRYNLFAFFISLAITTTCFGQGSWNDLPGKNNYKVVTADNTEDTLLSENDLYILDYLANPPQLLLRNKYGTIYALTDTTSTSLRNMDYNCMLDNKNCYLLWYPETFDLNGLLSNEEVTEVWGFDNNFSEIKLSEYIYSDRYKMVNFVEKPQKYIMILIKGQLYNSMTFDNYVDGPIKRAEPFCNPLAYYKTIVPVWR